MSSFIYTIIPMNQLEIFGDGVFSQLTELILFFIVSVPKN